MKLVSNWQQVYKSLAVVLPTIGNIILLIMYVLAQAVELDLIPTEYIPFVMATLTPILAALGRVIQQASLLLGSPKVEDQ